MNYKEIITFLDELMIENHFYMAARTDCLYKNESQINSMQDIFKLTKSSDFTYLYAVAELLSEDYENINKYLLKENEDSELVENIRLPTRSDKLLVATAFEENLEFFSMAWNWVAIVTAELAAEDNSKDRIIAIVLFLKMSDLFIKQKRYYNYFVRASAAGTPGFNNITRIPIDLLGELEIRGNSEAKRVVFVLFLNPENKGMKFELKINCEIANESYDAIIRKETSEESDEVSSMLIHADFSKGIHIKGIEWNPL